ncbi:MAG: hypothetical protein GY832_06145 [Chloroflexi bacterium]|nr:hypothetical protein [Chloroflexota bacterium]
MCPQIATGAIDLTCSITADAASVRSLAVSPWSGQVVRCFVSLGRGRWSVGWGVGLWRWDGDAVPFGGTSLGRGFCLLWWGGRGSWGVTVFGTWLTVHRAEGV